MKRDDNEYSRRDSIGGIPRAIVLHEYLLAG